jgi:4-hydroxy-4-methyl-2-oxoglutarate aldolase
VAALQEMPSPVFSRAINSKGTVKATLGSVKIPHGLHQRTRRPGHVVIADVDGVVVVPAERAAEVAAAARTRADNEEGKRKRSGAGELGLDVYSMRGPLEAAGLRYVD